MPVYTYSCDEGHITERIRHEDHALLPVPCDVCGETAQPAETDDPSHN